MLLLSAIRENVARQLESAQTFHGEDFSSSYYENIGKLIRIERALILSNPNDEIETGKKFDLFNWQTREGKTSLFFSFSILWIVSPYNPAVR